MSKYLVEALRRITELERRVSNIMRKGTIAEADYKKALVRVAIGPLLTTWLPWATQRAGNNRSWDAPEVGEQVLVISPSGELTQGVVLPALYQSAHLANADTPEVTRIDFADGAIIEYNREAHCLFANIPGSAVIETETDITATVGGKLTAKVTGTTTIESGGAATLKAPTVKIDSPATTITGTLRVQGKVNYEAGVAGGGDVVADGISLKNHVHGGVLPGSALTAGPQ